MEEVGEVKVVLEDLALTLRIGGVWQNALFGIDLPRAFLYVSVRTFLAISKVNLMGNK